MVTQKQTQKKNIVCPDCASNVEFCVEEVVFHKRIVDPKTGRLRKRIKTQSDGNPQERALFQCTSCSWSCTDGSTEYPRFLSVSNSDDVEALLDHVNHKAVLDSQ